MKLDGFLATVSSNLKKWHKMEDIGVRTVPYLFKEDVKDCNDAQIIPVTKISPQQGSWTYVVDPLLARFLIDDVLHEAHHRKSRVGRA